jgi:hypothetical protein
MVDEGVAAAVKRLLAAGFRTCTSCQWDGAPGKKFPAYINPDGPTHGAMTTLRVGSPAEMAAAIGCTRWRSYNGVLWFRPWIERK